MSRTLGAAIYALVLAAPSAAERQPMEGPIALNRFGARLEIGTNWVSSRALLSKTG